jgi:hypothetical protein
MRRRFEKILTRAGRLQRRYRPAVYFDTSVLVEYWLAEGLETADKCLPFRDEQADLLRAVLRAEKKSESMGKIRQATVIFGPQVLPVTTPLAVLELIEWHAHAAIKQMASDAVGFLTVQKKSRKEIGHLLRQLSDMEATERKRRRKPGPTTRLGEIVGSAWLNPSFAEYNGLDGIAQVDLVRFDLTLRDVWTRASDLAYHQIGLADIQHILAAHHLGCRYFASFDSDFALVEEVLKRRFKLHLLKSPQEILHILTKKPKS